MRQLVFIAVFSFLLSLSIGLMFIKIPIPKSLIDHPGKRKIHYIPTPLVGGFLILIPLIVSSLLFGLCKESYYNYYLILCTVFFLFGFMDDIYNWNYKKKLISQIIGVSLFLLIIPIRISILTFSSIEIQIPWLNYFFILIWIIAIINSFNFFDGINTLAGSLAIIFLASYGIMLSSNQSVLLLALVISLIFSIMGFLLYNRTPAKMFLGDSGAIFLGFIIATLPLLFATNNGVAVDVTLPVIITSILLMETIYLIFSRIKNKKNPFYPDRTHLHHQLLSLNFRNRYVVIVIVLCTILLSILAYFSSQLLFYQIVVIEFVLFYIIIVIPRFLKPKKDIN